MESLVLELQREAYQLETPITDLLRKAYTLTKKLKLDEFSSWLSNEMNGYVFEAKLPEYRSVIGKPLKFGIPSKLFLKRGVYAPVSEIEYYLQHSVVKKKGILYLHFPSDDKREERKATMELIRVEASQFYNILDRVRNIILEWALKLEEEGVFGENMTFSEKEKKIASEIPSTINYFGSMVNSQLQQNSSHSSQSLNVGEFKIESLKEIIEHGKLLLEGVTDDNTKAELKSELTVLEAQMISPKPKKPIIKECLASIRNIAEGATGSVLVGLVPKLVEVLSTL